ncbi:metallophosphatase [bacterium 1XD21-13]|nr:metallophosphatase [bacterium 1XD21-13]
MIYITGDCHGDFRRFNREIFPEQRKMKREDTVIILGDFGGVWDYQGENRSEKYWLDWLERKPYTTVFVDGNHENHVRLAEYPQKEWRGGLVHEIRPHVLHLLRGEIFLIEELAFFAFGGASSHDIRDGILDPVKDAKLIKTWSRMPFKMFRVDGVSWWKEELPSEEELQRGRENLKKHGNQVDYIITHSPSASVVAMLGFGAGKQDILTKYLEEIRQSISFKRHFCGHLHLDKQLNATDILLYEQIVRIA